MGERGQQQGQEVEVEVGSYSQSITVWQLCCIAVSQMLTNHEYLQIVLNTDFEKFSSATSTSTLTSHPTSHHRHHEHDDHEVPDSEDECISNADSYVETKVDSSLEQNTSELARSRPSRLH